MTIIVKAYGWDSISNTVTHLSEISSIIEDVSISATKSGYEVIINCNCRNFNIEGVGSGFSLNQETNHIEFSLDDTNTYHTVEWDIPYEYSKTANTDKHYYRFYEKEKDQVVVYFIESSFLENQGTLITEYKNPAKAITETLDKLLTKEN